MKKSHIMRKQIVAAAVAAIALAGLGACSSSSNNDNALPTSLVLADQQPMNNLNPIDGYADLGISPIYDGLLVPNAARDTELPQLKPALAASQPTPNKDMTVWHVDLRKDVTFHDGSAFDAKDVVATYRAIANPDVASPLLDSYSMIKDVKASGSHGVDFTLAYPYADLPTRLLVGIIPSEAVEKKPSAEWKLNTAPIGTGPYQLDSIKGDTTKLKAYDKTWHGAPQVKELTFMTVPDDTARAQQLSAKQISGTQLAPKLAKTFTGKEGFTVTANRTVDWRGLTLPTDNPFTADAKVRLALNIAIDRNALVKDVLAGYGTPASLPVNNVYGPVASSIKPFEYDRAGAEKLLDEAGWTKGADGIRAKDGNKAHMDLWYPAGDQLRKDLTFAVAAQLKTIGVSTKMSESDWDAVEKKLPSLAAMFGGGDQPYSIDTQLYGTLHSRDAKSDVFTNPTGSSVPGVDKLLDEARRTTDQDKRMELYNKAMAAYREAPSYLMLVFLQHTYVEQTNKWKGKAPILEPHSHGVTWGPWWNVGQWHK